MSEEGFAATPEGGGLRSTIIEPPSGWQLVDVRELWEYRELLWVMTTRDVKVRYKQTFLGAGWAILRPLLTMAIFTVVFGRFGKMPSDGYPYAIFVYAGLLPWTFFAGAVTTAANSLVGSSPLVSKVFFPRLIIPLSSMGAPLVDLLVSTAILLGLMLWYGVPFTPGLLIAVPLVLLILIIAAGVGTLLSALTVTFRDFTHITPFLVQLWMFATPVVFPLSVVPEQWRWVFALNPMTGPVEAFRAAFLGTPLAAGPIAGSLVAGLVLLGFGVAYFERVERRFADII